MTQDKIATQMKKGVLEYLILSIIAHRQVYASQILETLKDHELIIVEGTLYPLLSRLKTEQLVGYTRVESPQGPPRKYYTLTDHGMTTHQIMRDTRATLNQAVSSIDKD